MRSPGDPDSSCSSSGNLHSCVHFRGFLGVGAPSAQRRGAWGLPPRWSRQHHPLKEVRRALFPKTAMSQKSPTNPARQKRAGNGPGGPRTVPQRARLIPQAPSRKRDGRRGRPLSGGLRMTSAAKGKDGSPAPTLCNVGIPGKRAVRGVSKNSEFPGGVRMGRVVDNPERRTFSGDVRCLARKIPCVGGGRLEIVVAAKHRRRPNEETEVRTRGHAAPTSRRPTSRGRHYFHFIA